MDPSYFERNSFGALALCSQLFGTRKKLITAIWKFKKLFNSYFKTEKTVSQVFIWKLKQLVYSYFEQE